MLRTEKTGIPGMRGLWSDRAPLRRGTDPVPEGPTFDEELALFERQVREERETQERSDASTRRGSFAA